MSEWESVIGLEIHTQLSTASKIFSGAPTAYGAEPNTQACGIDIALPGVLPVLNHGAVRKAIKFGLAIDADITMHSVFARKNYYYPDLPKGYQISQFDLPIVGKGHIDITLDDGSEKRIGITRAHLEEDAGKSIHEGIPGTTGIDLNRAGTPLLEIVSEPDMRSSAEAIAYMKTIHRLVRYLDISDGNMQEGSFRCDVNVSVRRKGEPLGTRAEIKNINSFRFVERAIEHEIERQIDIIENGGSVAQETRLYDADKDVTRSMRSKEEAHDYRYFPDPDLLPLQLTENDIEEVRQTLPELPWEKCARYQNELGLNHYDAALLANHRDIADFFEHTLSHANGIEAKLAANWINGDLAAMLNKEDLSIDQSPVSAEKLAGLLQRIADKTISNNIGKQVFEALWNGAESADKVIDEKGLKQITDTDAIETIVKEIIANNPTQVEQYRGGKDKLFGFFVGQVMKATKGKANPEMVNQLLKDLL